MGKRLTLSEVKNRFIKRGYEPLFNEYNSAHEKLSYKCHKHPDKDLAITLNSLTNGNGCPYCAGNGAFTIEEVRQEFINRGYVPLFTSYKTVKDKLEYRCPKHPDKQLFTTYDCFKRGHDCPHCGAERAGKLIKKSLLEVKALFIERGYIPLFDEYKNAKQLLNYKCNKHPDKELRISFDKLTQGYGCPFCAGVTRITTEEARLEFEKRGYIPLFDKYESGVKMRYQCPNHPDKELSISMGHLRAGQGCPYCAGIARIPIEEVRMEFIKRDYIPVFDTYKNNKQKLQYRCKKHPEDILLISLCDLRDGNGCPKCNESQGEKSVTHFLKQNNIIFYSQHRFIDCRNKKPLPFDFYLPEFNACVEYDGRQHFEPIEYFGGVKALKQTQKRDKIKTDYCKAKNIKLIRIPYTVENITEYLDQQLNSSQVRLFFNA